MSEPALLEVSDLSYRFPAAGPDQWAVRDASLAVWPGEILAVVGESGSGKTTLLRCIAGRLAPTCGQVRYRASEGELIDVHRVGERRRRHLARTEWGFVEQDPREGLRMSVSAGANVGERLMDCGERHYDRLRMTARRWLERVELDPVLLDQAPTGFSGGMRQRLQIARNLVSRPRLVMMDEPTSGLDVSVQARLLDLIRGLVRRLSLSGVVVTHDLGVARLLADRTLVMQHGRVVESGLTDRVLDDPRHPYTQLLVSSALQP